MQGVVMETKNGKAVVFQKNGTVTEIDDRNYKIGQKINIGTNPYKKVFALAACFVLVFISGISGYTALYRTPKSYVYVDINPSLRLDINCFDKVISVEPLNSDAIGLMNSYSIHTSDTEKCIDEIVSACLTQKYLNEENDDIEFNVVTDRAEIHNCIGAVSEKLKKNNWKVLVNDIEQEENKEAMKYHSSPKRLKAVRDYTESFGGNLADNFALLKGVTNQEIYAKIEAAGIAPKSAGKYKSTPERLKAVKEYTDKFGGNLEENMKALSGIKTQEIYDAIEKQVPISSQENDN